MPDFEFEFNQQDRNLVLNQTGGAFGGTNYIRLTIYPTEAINNIVTLPNTDKQAIFYSSLNETSFDINISPFGIGTDVFDTYPIGGDNNDFKIYRNETTQDIYIKPNEIFNDFELPQGDYKIQIDFLNQVAPTSVTEPHYKFIIKQVSTSRKEVRLKIIDTRIGDSEDDTIQVLSDLLDTDKDGVVQQDKYQFQHVLNIGTGNHNPIMNYQFDAITNGKDNQSIILKLYEPLPTNVGNLSMVTIEKEVLTTQIQDIFYFSDVPDVFFGDGLPSATQENWINPDGNNLGFQSLDELAISSSIGDIEVDSLISQSQYGYPNLNTDFTEFKNHTFFGSAKKKLENFNTKVKTIQGYYFDISGSLSDGGGAIDGDSTFIIQKRKDLFDKINQEVKTFTPYERFLYYDAQSESTASAPSLKDYAQTTPVGPKHDGIELNQYDGFNIVYQRTNNTASISGSGVTPGSQKWIGITQDLYDVQSKPFFNYSSSIYLSFLMKGDETIDYSMESTKELKWDQFGMTTTGNGLGVPLPASSQYRNRLLQPSITGSEYRRFIYHSSMSYWIPNEGIDFSDIPTTNNAGELLNDSFITILGGSVKTSSYDIKDSTGKYPITVVSQSTGVPFKGSCMPAGELFRLYFRGDLGGITSSFMTDVRVTLKDPSDVLPFDNVFKTTSDGWTTWYNNALTQAENFDTDNIHSFENNLPLYIQESSDYNEMKDFLSLQGEQYDLIRNHIDSVGTIHKRGYKKTNSPPDNTLPMLLSNMGWQAINPFEGDLTETLGSYLSGVTSIDDIKNNTWRKTLNNLLYIYKSKGTKNSVRGLLNTYGYPPDVLKFQEFGGVVESSNNTDNPLNNNAPPPLPQVGGGVSTLSTDKKIDTNLNLSTGSFNFTTKKEKFYRYRFAGRSNRVLNLNWWMDSANINALEFVYKHDKTTNTQTILQSSGSGALKAEGLLQVLSGTTTDFDGTTFVISSSDGTGKTYIFDDDNDGATGTLDSAGRVRVQINGLTLSDEIATEISTSISHPNGHFGKIDASDSVNFLTNTGQNFITSDGDTLFANSSGSIILTQITASVDGNTLITTTAPSMSVSGFLGGSEPQSLWDLRLVPSSDGISSSFEFRLNNTPHASSSILSNAVSMSTIYSNMTDGQLWNVMLQRMSGSTSTNITHEYRLHSSIQNDKIISTYNYITMSVAGGSSVGELEANKNWMSTGSRHFESASNLYVGKTLTGSLAEIRGWATALSTSKFRQHTLNKFSIVGNSLLSHCKELIYHYKLNENYGQQSDTISGSGAVHPISSSTQNMIIVDSAHEFGNYNLSKLAHVFLTSSAYGFDIVDSIQPALQDNLSSQNDNNILINPNNSIVGNLNPYQGSVLSLTDKSNGKPKLNISPKLELYRSPQNFINDFIISKIGGFNLEKKYGNPLNFYSQSYGEFDTFREEFFDCYEIKTDVNKFIRSHESMFNHSLSEGLKQVVPARSTFSDKNSNFGVEIKPTILEKQKYEHHRHSIETNPNTGIGTIDVDSTTHIPTSTYESVKEGTANVNIANTSTYEQPKNASISVNVTNITTYEEPKSGLISTLPSYGGSTVPTSKDGTVDYASYANKSFENIHTSWGTGTNDTYFINHFNTGSDGNSNTYHIDTRFVFHTIGDNEYYSASMGNSSDFTDSGRFYNRKMITHDFHNDVNYESFIFGNPGLQKGRMMGKTRYFSSSISADGTTTDFYPRNHVSKFSNPFKDRMYQGTSNTEPKQLNVKNYEDYSSASFYRVKVTGGENQLTVKTPNTKIDNDDNIIY